MTIFGVVDRSKYSDSCPCLDIVEMDEASDAASRFHWGSSCAGWFPLGTFPTRIEAETFISEREAADV